MLKISELDADDRRELCQHIRSAMFHLASCWDALRVAEQITEGEIETDDISGITSEVSDPSEAYDTLDENIVEMFEGLEEELANA